MKAFRQHIGGGRAFLVGLALSIGVIGFVDSYYSLWLLGIWFAVFLAAATGKGPSWRRAIWFNMAVVIAVIGGGVFFFAQGTDIHTELTNPEYRSELDDLLGYRLTPGKKTLERKYTEDEVLYEATYTLEENGNRLAPPYVESEGKPCVLFFGGSHSFGAAVNDDETFPYLFGVKTGGHYEIHNFSLGGFGTHQMLAALEGGRVESVIDCDPRHVIYHGGYFHIPRSAGLSSWDQNGPHYELVDTDRVEYRGSFAESQDRDDLITRLIDLSGLDTLISGLHRPPDGHDYDRFLGILENSRRYVQENYPNAEFHVFLFDDKRRGPIPFYLFAWSRPPLSESLAERGFNVLHKSDAIPGLRESPELYKIHPLDGHPNALAHSLMASYLASKFSEDSTLSGEQSQ